ncbi:hypothetical protein CDAR_548831 [Caerostris darwini]|uniref:Uncharacterized protein n=1 Tax=Caerostris darwini TaxID=1538125 RepID=A0AAV4WLT5_9ARAC|nr:hypothetical protein CDAR_548831 [Caerostris darwini]
MFDSGSRHGMVHSRDPFLTPYDVTSLRCPPVRWEQRVGELTSRPSIGKGLRKRIYSAVSINDARGAEGPPGIVWGGEKTFDCYHFEAIESVSHNVFSLRRTQMRKSASSIHGVDSGCFDHTSATPCPPVT